MIPSRSVPAGLAAIVRYLPSLSAEENEAAMLEALDQVATGEVTVASRDVELDGVDVRKGAWLGLADGSAVASSSDFDEVACAVAEKLLGDGREVLTLLTGEDEPDLAGFLARLQELHPAVELDVQPGRPAALPAAPLRRVGLMVPAVADEPQPIRVLLVEDNDVFRQALILLLELQDGIEVVGAVPDGNAAVGAYREHRPDVVVMDFRLPGHGRRRDDPRARERVSRGRGRLPDRVGEPTRARRADGRRRDRLPAQGRGARRDRQRDPACGRGEGAPVNLTSENTAIVLDSTADFPDAQIRFPNMRVVPLYVRFGEESFRDYVELDPHDFYERLKTAPELPTTSQPTPQDFLTVYHALAGYERIYSLHISAKLSGTFQSASLAATEEGDRIRLVDTRVGVGRDRDARDRDPGAARARHDRRGGRGADRDATASAPGSSSRSTRSSSSPRAAGSGAARRLMGSLLNVKPILAIDDGEVHPVTRARGRAKAFEEFRKRFEEATTDGPGLSVAIAHAEAAEAVEQLREIVLASRPQADVKMVTSLGAVVGTHAGPGTVGFFWYQPDALAGCASRPAEPASGAASRRSRRSSRRAVPSTVPPAYAPRPTRQERQEG